MLSTRTRLVIFAATAVALGPAGCGGDTTHWTTGSGLEIEQVAEGEGERPRPGDILGLIYVASYVDGGEFDRYQDREEPYRFRLGSQQVLPGLEEGVAGMRVGGKRILRIPPELAFENGERPSTVPADAWVRMEVELVDIIPSPPAPEPWSDEGFEIMVTETGLQYVDFKVGEGDVPEMGNTIVVRYSGFLDDGTLFDTTYFRGVPIAFVLGEGGLVPGWLEGLLTMRVGGQRKLIIPPYLGYGEKGFKKRIPPNATLIFDIELLSVERPRQE
ncbi:MAG: FKBP-type peptidyl-prolyl cis-trans isomerase [Candidatus Krumholzibacteriia bacterium]